MNRNDIEMIDNEEIREFLKSIPPCEGKGFHSLLPNADPVAIELLTNMLRFNPNQRITAKEALESPFFKGMRRHEFEVSFIDRFEQR